MMFKFSYLLTALHTIEYTQELLVAHVLKDNTLRFTELTRPSWTAEKLLEKEN